MDGVPFKASRQPNIAKGADWLSSAPPFNIRFFEGERFGGEFPLCFPSNHPEPKTEKGFAIA